MNGPAPSPRQTAALLARLLRAHATAAELLAVEALASAAAGTDAAALRAARDAVAPIVERLTPSTPPPSGERSSAARYEAACLAADEAEADVDAARDALAAAEERATLASEERRLAYAMLRTRSAA